MRVIDADTHVDETEDTWAWLRGDELAFTPTTGFPTDPDPTRPPTRYWIVEGRRHPRQHRDDRRTGTTRETRELHDPHARVRHMDELGVAIQIVYPTLFLISVTETPAVEVALKRSYNRWMADRCQQTGGRLRWICVPPLTDISAALEEIRFAKANGACGVLKKGDREAGRWVSDEYFFPIWEACERWDLPVCFHIGSGTPDSTPAREFRHARFIKIGVPPVHAFHGLAQFGIPAKFPGVRWGFFEAGASWVPYVVYDLVRRTDILRARQSDEEARPTDLQEIVRQNNFYIACQVDEDLPYILRYTGEDRLLIGSDYGHGDASQERDFASKLWLRAEQGEVSRTAVTKILSENPRRFYGL